MSATPVTDLSRAMVRCAWAGTLLGFRSLTAMGQAAASLDALSAVARQRLPPWQKALFQAGEDLQNLWFDRLPRRLDAAAWQHFMDDMLGTVTASFRILRPDQEGLAARQEWMQKAGVYLLVQRASTSLGTSTRSRQDLEQAIAQIRTLSPRHTLWMLEGVGHGHAQAALRSGQRPSGLLRHLDLPEGEALMLHLGLGMALAEHLLTTLGPLPFPEPVTASAPCLHHPPSESRDAQPRLPSDDALHKALREFAELCQNNAQPQHMDAVLEALGLVVRCFFPELTTPVARALAAAQEPVLQRAAELYWHGVGRAVYFLPLHLIPGFGTFEAGLARVDAETPPGLPRDEAHAGFAYAATLVNLGWPVVLERLLMRSPECWDIGCSDGMLSAVLMRHRVTPQDPELATFLAHRPADVQAQGLWQRLILRPIQAAMDGDGIQGPSAVTRTLVEPMDREAAP